MSFNKTILMGNLTRDVELRHLPTGTAVADFSVAVNRKWKTPEGEEREEVSFIDVTAFGRQAEVIQEYFKKGKPILVEGRLKQDTWVDKATEQKRSKVKVVLEGFSFCGGNRQEEGGGEQQQPRTRKTATAAAQPSDNDGGAQDAPPPDEDDDVPF